MLPKILPQWQDMAAQSTVRDFAFYSSQKLPDYSGAGVDVTFNDDEIVCHAPKSSIDEIHFGAQVCALPFLSPNKVSQLNDPCLSPINVVYEDLKMFSIKLAGTRNRIAQKTPYFRNKVYSLQKVIRKKLSRDTNEKVIIPKNIMELVHTFSENIEAPKVNYGYTGGCLATSQDIDNQHLLLYPTGHQLNKLAIISLEEACESNKTFKPIYSGKSVIKLKNDCIQQVKSDFNGYCYVRQEGHCHFVNFANLQKISHHECEDQQKAINIAASPYNPMELISIYGCGKIELSDIDERKTLWTVNKHDYAEPFIYNTLRSSNFGSHPKSVLCLTDRRLYSFDLRSMDKERSTIFTNEHPTLSLDEKFFIIKALGVNPFQHFVSSNYHLFLFDERYPGKPILMWNHLLGGSPLYCDLACYIAGLDRSDAVIVLGTQESHELVSFAVSAHHSKVETLSLTPPLSLSSSTDCAETLKLQCIDVADAAAKRLAYPLVGVTAVPHSKEVGFTAFHMTSLGDLFYQDFRKGSTTEKTYKVDTGCVLAPSDKILPALSEWINKINRSSSADNYYGCDLMGRDVVLRAINFSPEPLPSCSACRLDSNVSYEEDNSNTKCSSCGLDNLESKKIMKAFDELSLIAGPMGESPEIPTFDTSDLTSYTDPYSKKLLEPWISSVSLDDEVGTPEWEYSSDFSLSTMSPAPSSSQSHSNFCSTPINMDDSEPFRLSQNTTLQSDSHDLSFINPDNEEDVTFSQESARTFVPPSQEVRSLIGETIRKPKRHKSEFYKTRMSSSGF